MESGVLGNLLAPFGRGLLVIFGRKINPIKETPIIYPYFYQIRKPGISLFKRILPLKN
ncbi:MAG: hypothetical protein Q8764_02690 [Pigeon pea little leaf phytoplasma]|uniref:Uncharacterized protein n=1 Tax=Candidatus Phytoplasma fabacearum TaxID=2982628 RepID=A0ABU8ZUJ8_9MOLU|nr:hypothetical protein ['Bituminaria bituminosa' little leaf phytoplasma]MDV3161766.1 hypothetical protein [Pigeon pea little leaf phytoplasma]MDO7983851.1 hypothetical protein ['Bituminaria bituminosa' little leaf phytoplasma]MDO8024032.1 hypothetical protein ['Bituminaria bituminosa' little leaf phytoplasma]MDO8030843.1 hypothetical protein ['Bituminaria bituminosa' little leaf phytoplasma]MDV3196934.1 hypothetical protein [Pigeon pea little leaf phytoplasma]